MICFVVGLFFGLDNTVRFGGFQFHREGQQIREETEKGVTFLFRTKLCAGLNWLLLKSFELAWYLSKPKVS